MYKAIIFDLDQTLADRDATFTNFLREQHHRFSSSLNGIEEAVYISFVKANDNNGYTPKTEVYALACQEFELDIPVDTLLEDFREHYGKQAVLLTDACEVLETLSQNYKLGLITNGRSKGQRAKINSTGIGGFFSSIKVSGEEGVKKPDPKIYHSCLNELGLEAGDCVFVGDNPLFDVSGAKAVGMKAIWLKNPYFDEPEDADWIVEDLWQILEIFQSENTI